MSIVGRAWFYITTNILRLDGTTGGVRFKNSDKPPQATFENLTDSVTFKIESSDRAKLYDGSADLSLTQGLSVLATDVQAKANQTQLTDRSLVVQPSQLPTVSPIVDDFTVSILPADGDPSATQDVFTTIPDSTTTRNNFIIKFALDFKKFILARIVPTAGNIGDVLIKKTSTSNDTEWGNLASTTDPAVNQLFTNLTNNTTFITNLTTSSAFVTDIQNTITQVLVSNPTFITDSLPVGVLLPYAAGTTISSKYLIANGASLLRASYPDLFALIGTTYGSVDGTHFTLPDARGRQLISVSGSHTLGTSGGSETNTIVSANLPDHNHDFGNLAGVANGNTDSSGDHSHSYIITDFTNNTFVGAGTGVTGSHSISTSINGAHTHPITNVPVSLNFGETGGGGFANTPLTTVDPYLTINYVIKAIK